MVKGENLSRTNWLVIGMLILVFPVAAVIVTLLKPADGEPTIFEKYNIEALKFDSGSQKSPLEYILNNAELSVKTYPFEDWGAEYIEYFELGPTLLTRDIKFDVKPFSGNSTQETVEELLYLRELAKTKRDAETLQKIKDEAKLGGPALAFDRSNLFLASGNKDTEVLLNAASNDLRFFVLKKKKEFARVRPSTLDHELEVVVDNPPYSAYPSGHAAQGHMTGLLLAMIDEKHADAYKSLGYDIGHRREIAGIHFPSDSEAGRQLAEDVLKKLLEVPEFQEMLDKAKATYIAPALFGPISEEDKQEVERAHGQD